MADVTVDSLQIEIEASSEKAVEKLNALTSALKSLQAATKGRFGDIQRQIQGLGDSAEVSPAVARTRKKRAALDRATGRSKTNGALDNTPDLEALQAEYRKVGEAFDAALSKFEQLKASEREIHKTRFLYDDEAKEINKAAQEVDRLSDKYHELRKQIEAANAARTTPETKTQTADPWAEIKEKMKDSTLGEIIGDAATIDEAVSRMVELGDQASILQVKMEGLREKLTGAFEKGNQTQIANYTSQIQKLQSQIAELKDTASQAVEPETEMVESETSLQKKLGVLQKIRETIEGISANGSIGKSLGSVEGLKGILGKDLSMQSLIPKGAASGVNALGGAFGGLRDKMLGVAAAHPILAAALVGVTIATKTVGKGMKSLAQSAASAARKGFELLAAGVKKLTSALINLVTSGIGKAISGLKSLGKSIIKNVTGPFTKSAEKISKWKQMLSSALFYSTVFRGMSIISNGLKEGATNLYEYSRLVGTEFAPAMNSLATSALYLKNSLGAMAAPLVQALAPAIDFLIDKFVALINVIGKAFAVLTGKSVYTQAKKHAVEYGEAANKASKATKDFLLGIDELNVLNDSAGGGGGAATDFGSMFEEVEVPTDQFDWVKQIREAIENGEWRSVGELVAEKLNEVVESWDSYSWGQKLGSLINNGLNVAYGFLTKFDFEKLGSKVADGLNGIFDTVDWDLLGRTFAAKWNALFDFIYGFATTLKWHEIGLDIAKAINGFLDELDAVQAAEAVSKFVVGIFDTISTAITETKWDVLGTKLADFINKVDWYGAIYGGLNIITKGLAALKKAIDSFLVNWKWNETAKQIYTAINNAWKDVDWPGLGKTLGDMVITALKFAVDVISNIDWPKIGRDIGNFLINIDWVKVFGGLTDVIAAGITAAVGALGGLIDTIAPKMKEIASGIAKKVNEFFDKIDWAETGQVLSKGIESALDFMIEFMQKVDWDSIGRHIAEFLENIDWDTLLTKWGQLLGEFMTAKMKLIDVSGILDVGANIVKGLWDGMLAKWEAGGGVFGWIQRNIFGALLNWILDFFGIHSPSKVFSDIGVNLIEGLRDGIESVWDSIVQFFQSAFGPIADAIGKAWDWINGDTELKLVEMSTIANDTVSGMKTGMDKTMGEIVGTVEQAWKDTNTNTNTEWSNITRDLNNSLDGINTDVNTQFDTVKTAITTAWDNARKDTFGAFEDMKTDIHEKTGEIQTQATTDFKGVADNIRSPIDDVVKDAKSWGEDICKNLSDGMEGIGKGLVAGAATGLAQSIRDRLHFSEPDVGPLSDFHTYMPDMLDLMSRGIKDNTYKAVGAANELAGKMSQALGNIGPVEPKFSSLPTLQLSGSYSNAQAGGNSISSYSPPSAQGNDNSDVIAALNAGFQALIETINSQDYGTHLDGRTLMQSVERAQRQRGANIMGGGILG
ncbi:hypothetical protein D1641_09625 [Colidextribacter sp. OB.20]|uniref:phage tail protein n=1 Tax=Colidextribacter sp. OB.20 TaxID=2304568 RepID=UPI00136A9E29|nr:hypothetical protein [Colidextribacter sp. OB.20]NBI10267.1 hypothetical protein [Colidextribacter sp. OB.20]